MDKQNYNDQDHLTSKDLLKVIIDIAQHSATREELRDTRAELNKKIDDTHSELNDKIDNVRLELKTDIGEVRTELRDFRIESKHNMFWIIGTMITLMGLLPNLDTIISFFK